MDGRGTSRDNNSALDPSAYVIDSVLVLYCVFYRGTIALLRMTISRHHAYTC